MIPRPYIQTTADLKDRIRLAHGGAASAEFQGSVRVKTGKSGSDAHPGRQRGGGEQVHPGSRSYEVRAEILGHRVARSKLDFGLGIVDDRDFDRNSHNSEI